VNPVAVRQYDPASQNRSWGKPIDTRLDGLYPSEFGEAIAVFHRDDRLTMAGRLESIADFHYVSRNVRESRNLLR